MSTDGSSWTRLTDTPEGEFISATNEVSPTWSPDGKKIAFVEESAGDSQIYIISSDGECLYIYP
jgi:TolB protein